MVLCSSRLLSEEKLRLKTGADSRLRARRRDPSPAPPPTAPPRPLPGRTAGWRPGACPHGRCTDVGSCCRGDTGVCTRGEWLRRAPSLLSQKPAIPASSGLCGCRSQRRLRAGLHRQRPEVAQCVAGSRTRGHTDPRPQVAVFAEFPCSQRRL